MSNLVFLGAPDSGKTELIKRARALIEEKAREEVAREYTLEVSDKGKQEESHQAALSWFIPLAIKIDFNSSKQIHWDALKRRIRDASEAILGERQYYEEIAPILREHKKGESEELFETFKERRFRIFFLIDNIDQGLDAEHGDDNRDDDSMVTAQDILKYAQDSPSVVKVIMTSSRWRDEFDSYYFSYQWLKLLSAEDAKEWARLCLQSGHSTSESATVAEEDEEEEEDDDDDGIEVEDEGQQEENRKIQTVLEWAGYHPYYIRTLCDKLNSPDPCREQGPDKSRLPIPRLFHRPASQEEIAIKCWQDEEELQSHLDQLWEYLALYNPALERQLLTLTSILEGQPLNERMSKGVEYLRRRSIVSVEDPPEIPSRLVREFLGQKVRVGVVKRPSIRTILTTITSGEWVYPIVFLFLFAVAGIVAFEGATKKDLTSVYSALLMVFGLYAILLFSVRVLKLFRTRRNG